MQLTDAEIREILIRKKKAQMLRKKRRRRNLFLLIIILIILLIIVLAIRGLPEGVGKFGRSSKASEGTEQNRGVLFIDPGHGGVDSGSDDDNGRYEKDDTLRLSIALSEELKERGFTVKMSRTEDVDVDRDVRSMMANDAEAQLFVSIHRNKASGGGEGVEGFIPKNDNKESRLLGENLMHALATVGFTERTIRAGTLNDSNDDYEENKYVTMPAVLIEVGFLSSEKDNALFDNKIGDIAHAMANGMERTFMELYEPDKYAEFAAQEAAAGKVAKNTVKSTVKASLALVDRSSGDSGEDAGNEEETGQDPQA